MNGPEVFARPAVHLVMCWDGYVSLNTFRDLTGRTLTAVELAGLLRGMAAKVEAHPEGLCREAVEPPAAER